MYATSPPHSAHPCLYSVSHLSRDSAVPLRCVCQMMDFYCSARKASVSPSVPAKTVPEFYYNSRAQQTTKYHPHYHHNKIPYHALLFTFSNYVKIYKSLISNCIEMYDHFLSHHKKNTTNLLKNNNIVPEDTFLFQTNLQKHI